MENFTIIDSLLTLKNNGEIGRIGKAFSTKNKNYFYDTGTGKVLELDEVAAKIVNTIFSDNTIKTKEDLLNLYDIDSLKTFENDALISNTFQAKKPKRLYTFNHYENLENKINNELEQIILELTGKCNLRCKYCIYNDNYEYDRNFNNTDMSEEIAKASIDYLYEHSKKSTHRSVTFYGGEPLIKFNLLKKTIDYARSKFNDEVNFSLTTNLTLITEEIAKYLGSIPNISIVCSLDGPEDIQNKCRVYANGKKTFSDAIKGLELLSKEIKKNGTASIMINAVYTPPYSYEGIKRIGNYFESLDFLPKETTIQITYPSDGTYNYNGEDSKLTKDHNPIWEWIKDNTKRESLNGGNNSKYTTTMFSSLIRIQNRYLVEKPLDYCPFNSCCVPGARRLYVNTTGDFYLCEKIGTSPSIGNIREGIDIDRIKKYYIKDYNEAWIKKCKNCWAIHMCPFCYANRYNESGIDQKALDKGCESAKNGLVEQLILYHSLMETNSEKIKEISTITQL